MGAERVFLSAFLLAAMGSGQGAVRGRAETMSSSGSPPLPPTTPGAASARSRPHPPKFVVLAARAIAIISLWVCSPSSSLNMANVVISRGAKRRRTHC